MSKAWQRLANHNSLWEAKCREVKLEVPVSDNPIWKRVFRDNLYLRLNWNSGACRVTDFKGHTLKSVKINSLQVMSERKKKEKERTRKTERMV